MAQIKFDPGEEKLALAFDHISALQAGLMQVHARGDVDMILIGALARSHPNLVEVFESWKDMTSTYAPKALLAQVSGSEVAKGEAEKSRRVAFWTEALQNMIEEKN
ncbi:hypothetical protein KR767_04075 [Luteibacter anthropi]|uniref:hypothetical protein n=1 Tax=Luteibacter anthropi TaxID=564369 RepID=UPI00203264A1|nr:hypothetical protein [Luteibacter anthropi]URX63254.1 hypothetical protein KR767_04075 [Luteibacter anthropi]